MKVILIVDGIKPWHVATTVKSISVFISLILREGDKHITSEGEKYSNNLPLTLWNCDDADSQRLTFRCSFVECHFLHTAQFWQAQTCQPAITMSAATIQLLFSTPLSDCLSPPLTLTWTLMSKTEAAIRHVACGYWNVCTHRFLTWGDHHAVLSTVHAYTQQNHIVWITKHSSSYYESKVYLNDFNMLIVLPFPVFVCLYSPIVHFYTHRYVQHFSSAYVCDILCIWQVNY